MAEQYPASTGAYAHLQVVILGAGEGTRLRPLTIGRPKTLAPVCNMPLLARARGALSVAGIRRCRIGARAVVADSVLAPNCHVGAGERLPPFTVIGPYSVAGGE